MFPVCQRGVVISFVWSQVSDRITTQGGAIDICMQKFLAGLVCFIYFTLLFGQQYIIIIRCIRIAFQAFN